MGRTGVPLMMVGLLTLMVGALANQTPARPPQAARTVMVSGGPLLVATITLTDGTVHTLPPGQPVPSAAVVKVVAVATSSPGSTPPGCVATVNGVDYADTAPAGGVARCQWPPG